MISIALRPDLTHFSLQANLDSETFTLLIRWNARALGWFMDIFEEDGETLILAGVRLVANFPLGMYRADRRPAGYLYAWDTTGVGIDPGLGELGDRVKLIYFTAADLAAAGL